MFRREGQETSFGCTYEDKFMNTPRLGRMQLEFFISLKALSGLSCLTLCILQNEIKRLSYISK